MAEELASPLHPLLDGPMVIRTHVREAPEGTVEALEGSGQIEATWALYDFAMNPVHEWLPPSMRNR
jgi:hypothetical protein